MAQHPAVLGISFRDGTAIASGVKDADGEETHTDPRDLYIFRYEV